jgi:hypothetical protein
MAGRIFGARIFGSRVYGRVFGGLSGTAAPEILGWLPVLQNYTWKRQPFPQLNTHQPGWAYTALSLLSAQFAAVRNAAYQPPHRAKLSYPLYPWHGSTAWMQTAADTYTASVSGWRSGGELPQRSTRGVRSTVFDLGWITRATPGAPIPDVAFIAGINPEKGGYTLSLRSKHPYLRYEYTPQFGWNWYGNVLPVILAGTAAISRQATQDYSLRARKIAPYMQSWSAERGWIRAVLDAVLASSWPAIATETAQAYTLSGRERGAYLPSWFPQAGWLYAATQVIVRDTYPAITGQQQQAYPVPGRARLRLPYGEWGAQHGWIYGPSFINIIPLVSPMQSGQMPYCPMRSAQVLYQWVSFEPQPADEVVPTPAPAVIVTFIGSSFTREG